MVFNDIIKIEGRTDRRYQSLIYNIQWSLKNGMVKFQKGDSTIWTLKDFKRQN